MIIGLVLGGWPRAPIPRAALLAGLCLAGLAALTLLSGLWAGDGGRVFAELVRVLAYLGLFALVVIASPAGSARQWLAGLAVGLLAVAALALGSRLQPELFPANELVSFLPNTRARLSYPLQYWNGLAALLALSFVMLAGFGAHGAHARRAGRPAVGALPVPALALFLTSSRGGCRWPRRGRGGAGGAGARARPAADGRRARRRRGPDAGGAGARRARALIDGHTETAAAQIQGDQLLAVTHRRGRARSGPALLARSRGAAPPPRPARCGSRR